MEKYITPRYAAAVDEIQLPPQAVDPPGPGGSPPGQTVVSDTMIAPVIISANLLLTIVVVAGMMVDGTTAKQAMIAGAAYFGLSTFAYVAIVTGMATAVTNAWQRERTERQRIDAYERVMMAGFAWRRDIERTKRLELQERRPPTVAVQRLSPLNSYVPAYADAGDQAQAAGLRWAQGLYDDEGLPDGRKLHEGGRLRVRMIGSKRGNGSRESGLWLIRQGVIRKVAGGYALNVAHFPTLDSLADLA